MSTNLYKLSKYVLVCCLAYPRKEFILPMNQWRWREWKMPLTLVYQMLGIK